nr:E3 SUMO-protein ligase KIAA1586-like [Hydra vulgaris]
MDANKDHRRRLSTVKKWEKLLNCELEYDLNGDEVIRLSLQFISTDSAVSEQELIYILYLKDGSPKVEFLSIETGENSNAVGLKKCITDAFTRVGITNSYKHLLGVNLDGANVNLGAYAGLGALLKEGSPWLEVVHCFNHRLELALKDAFESLSAFKTVDELLLQLYYLYQKSPKRYRELQGLAEAWGNSVPKPTNACGTRWIDRKYKAMKIALENYGVFMTHIEPLAITDSQIAKRAELKGFLKRWKNASVPINLSIYLDVLSPLRRLSLSFQNNIHDSVKAVSRVQEFTWTMAKLQILLENLLDNFLDDTSVMTHYKRLSKDIRPGE